MNLRIGILSFAHVHAENYAAILRNAPEVELVGFSDEDRDAGRHFEEKFGMRWFARHQDLLAEGLDGAVICSENGHHQELVEMAAEAKCQILCEKPIEIDLASAE